ncbi:hypothetical protein ACGF5C_11625 [Micromonospora sp. NPDC047620]|uniref:hypothetical protein n=1 Tax=Micromonospora sp. NPDC047620 TaxID=3364251 RepID=UPI00372031FD
MGADERRVLGLAEQLLTRECMRRAGFELWVVPPAPADPNQRYFAAGSVTR